MNRVVSFDFFRRFVSSLLLTAIIFTQFQALGQRTGAQGLATDTLFLDVNQDIAVQLLPFDQLVKVALAYSPVMKYQREIINVAEAGTNVSKAQILQNVNGFGNYSAGNQSLVTTGVGVVDTNPLGQIANGYRFGVDARVSLYDLFGRKHQIKQAQANQRAAEAQLGVLELQLRQQLITLYQDMITTQQILKLRLVDEQASLAAYRIAEAEMQKGSTSASVFASVTTQYVQTKTVSEQVKGDFLKQVHSFEALMGVPIQRLKR